MVVPAQTPETIANRRIARSAGFRCPMPTSLLGLSADPTGRGALCLAVVPLASVSADR